MILSIIKGIGCVIGILLLVILVYIVLVCILPIRYELDGDYHDRLDGSARIRYMPIGLKILIAYHNEQLQYTVRLLGGVVATNTGAKISWLGRKLFQGQEQTEEADGKAEQSQSEASSAGDDRAEIPESNSTASVDTGMGVEEESKVLVENLQNNTVDNAISKKAQPKKRSSLIQRIRKWIQSMKKKLRRALRKGQQWNKKKEAMLQVYHSQRFAVAKKDVKGYMKRLWHILKPEMLEGDVHFGFEDPATTGEVLGVLACILPLYQNYLTICPDFEQACLQGHLRGKGKIYLGAVVILLLQILRNKNLIKVTKKVQTIIEA